MLDVMQYLLNCRQPVAVGAVHVQISHTQFSEAKRLFLRHLPPFLQHCRPFALHATLLCSIGCGYIFAGIHASPLNLFFVFVQMGENTTHCSGCAPICCSILSTMPRITLIISVRCSSGRASESGENNPSIGRFPLAPPERQPKAPTTVAPVRVASAAGPEGSVAGAPKNGISTRSPCTARSAVINTILLLRNACR